MIHEPPHEEPASEQPSSLRGLLPWYFEPTAEQLRKHLVEGLVAFDTNALFDAYRLNPAGRAEFLRSLSLLGDRLWVPHRVAEEFLERRLDVIRECSGAVNELKKKLASPFSSIENLLKTFANQRGLSKKQADELQTIISQARNQIMELARDSYQFKLKAAESVTEDPILAEVEKVLEGRIGPPLKDMGKARQEAAYRFERLIPPGYGDEGKPPEKAIGDYVLWAQLLEEVQSRPRPVLFVTNEKKSAQDWVVPQLNDSAPLPRPELCAEVWERARQPFYLVSVRRFLTLANEHLGAEVSEETIAQAEEIFSQVMPEPLTPLERTLAEMLVIDGFSQSSSEASSFLTDPEKRARLIKAARIAVQNSRHKRAHQPLGDDLEYLSQAHQAAREYILRRRMAERDQTPDESTPPPFDEGGDQ